MPHGNYFYVSNGNLKVLETIPKMMRTKKYKKELRLLTLKFLQEFKEFN